MHPDYLEDFDDDFDEYEEDDEVIEPEPEVQE